ncbi:MAG: hypothetical protein ACRCV7_03515 [Culicoidibacterales bacterium]
MKKRLMALCMSIVALATVTGCGVAQKDYKAEEFASQTESYKKGSQELMQKLVAMKYEHDSENKIKEKDEYKKIAEALKYFENLKESSAPGDIQEHVKKLKEKSKTMLAYYDSMVKSYVDAKGDQTAFIKALSEIIRKDENKLLVKEFVSEMVDSTPKNN